MSIAEGALGRTPLLMTAASGRVECLKTLLHHGAQVNSTDDKHATALTLAAEFGHMACVEALLEHKTVDIHVRHQSKNQAIHYASMKGHNDILVKLIEKGADVDSEGALGRTPLLATAASGRVECLKTLLHHGAQVNSTDDKNATALTLAAEFGHMACVEALLEHETVDIHVRHQSKNQAIHYASMKGHNDILVKLIEKGADVDSEGALGRTPLLATAASGRVECLKTLLHHGAQVNSTDDQNDTALTLAAYFGHMTCVEALLEHETVDIHVRHQSKNQAIHYASMKGHNDILVKLIEKGADVDSEGALGRTPLLATAASGRVECLKTLLHHGAQINSTDDRTRYGIDPSSIISGILHVLRHSSNTKLLISSART